MTEVTTRKPKAGCRPIHASEIYLRDLPPDFLDMLPTDAVRRTMFPPGSPHNSIWDFVRGPDGRFFVSLCAEGRASASAQLHEYVPGDGTLRFCFDLAQVCMVSGRAIPPSKIHTSMDFTRDGAIVMTTHTTAPAPSHAHWMIDAYYSHQWEGFAGGNLLLYDPKSGEVRNLGVPVPRESLYGGVYDPKHHAYYMLGYLRGHLYRCDLATGEVRDFGQVSEFASCRITRGPDGHLYGSSRTGWIYRVDVDRRSVEDLGQQLPGTPGYQARRAYISGCVGADGRLYMANQLSDRLAALDVRAGRLEDLGSADPVPAMKFNGPRTVTALSFDAEGRLWYALLSQVGSETGVWTHLARWDIARGGKPEIVGLLGTPDRALWCCSCEIIHTDGVLYIADTNHADDPPGILAIDLAKLHSVPGRARERCRDPHAYVFLSDGDRACADASERFAHYRKHYYPKAEEGAFMAENAFVIRAQAVGLVRLWRHVPPEQSSVRLLRWRDDRTLEGICGDWDLRAFLVVDGRLQEAVPLGNADEQKERLAGRAGLDALPAWVKETRLPHRQGRQFLARPSCCAPWNGGRMLIGTLDGMLALLDIGAGTVFSLGAVAPHGPVHQIVTNVAQTLAYGVAGDRDDLGHCFRFDDVRGVWELGRTFTSETELPGLACSCRPCCLALSPDEQRLAIGVADRLGTVYIYRGIEETSV